MARNSSRLLGLLALGAAFAAVRPEAIRAFAAEPLPAADGPAMTSGAPSPGQLERGARIYRTLCLACHMPDGRGVAQAVPPLAGADYLLADPIRAVRLVLQGMTGPVVVNGAGYDNPMPPLAAVLTDEAAADVLTYVLNSWGNRGPAIASAGVAAVRMSATPRVTSIP